MLASAARTAMQQQVDVTSHLPAVDTFLVHIIAASMVRRGLLRWLGHVDRMPDDGLSKIILFASLTGAGLPDKPCKPWRQHVRKDMHELGVACCWYSCTEELRI